MLCTFMVNYDSYAVTIPFGLSWTPTFYAIVAEGGVSAIDGGNERICAAIGGVVASAKGKQGQKCYDAAPLLGVSVDRQLGVSFVSAPSAAMFQEGVNYICVFAR